MLITGWTDAKHGWVTLGATPPDRYFTLIHAREDFFARTCFAYVAFGLAPTCPLAASRPAGRATNPALVENRPPPFGTRQLVFNLEPDQPTADRQPLPPEPAPRWLDLPGRPTARPSQKLVNAWRSILGDSDADTRLDQVDNCPLVANAEQVDSDANGTGDACGPTFAQGTVGGSVPATLALTLGAPATFGAFVPGRHPHLRRDAPRPPSSAPPATPRSPSPTPAA